jgi:hypothetical protein
MRKAIGFLLFILLSCTKEDSLTCVPSTFSDSYICPIKPGTDEWIKLGSRDERAQACMIPAEKLETISTGGLFESLLSFPFIIDYRAWDKYQAGFEKLKSENSGFEELYSREDLYQVIIDWYGPLSTKCEEWIYHPDNAPVGIELEIIEMFIFQNDFLDSLDHQEEVEIFKLVYNKLLQRSIEGGKWIAAAILGKIMFRNGYTPFVNECNNNDFLRFFIDFIPSARPVDLSPTEIIEKYARDFYKTI